MIAYIYDISVAVILIVCIGVGYKRGLLRTVLYLLCFLISFAVASAVSSDAVVEPYYEKYFREKIVSAIDSSIEDAKERAEEKLKEAVKQEASEALSGITGIDGLEIPPELIDDVFGKTEEFISDHPLDSAYISQIDFSSLLTNERISGKIKEAADICADAISEKLNNMLPLGISISPDSISDFLMEEDTLRALFTELLGDKTDADSEGIAEYMERIIVRPAVLRAMGIVVWAAVFAAANIFLRMIISVILLIRHISPIKAADEVLGGLLGAAEGAVIIAICTAVVAVIIAVTGGVEWMNEELITQTFVFRHIYAALIDVLPGLI
ncbi:MAG: hypothetical protein ACI4KF_01110 [Huintestinicola sp.]